MRKLVVSAAVCMAALAGCAEKERRMPVTGGSAMTVAAAPEHKPYDASALQIRWFGTATYAIELGELSVLTDPFVSNGLSFRGFESRKEEAERVFGALDPEPRAIFVNHTHVDHFLDAHHALEEWPTAKLFAGASAANILAGFQELDLKGRFFDVADHPAGNVDVDEDKTGTVDRAEHWVRYQSFKSKHTPHARNEFGWYTFFNGIVDKELDRIPRDIDYKTGEVYNYLFEFGRVGSDEPVVTVFFLGSPYSLACPLPSEDTDIDVLIMPVGSAANVNGYPGKWIERLKPRHIVLSHYNNFFAIPRRPKPESCTQNPDPGSDDTCLDDDRTLFAADVTGFLLDLQRATDYDRLERIHVPAIANPSLEKENTIVRIPFDTKRQGNARESKHSRSSALVSGHVPPECPLPPD